MRNFLCLCQIVAVVVWLTALSMDERVYAMQTSDAAPQKTVAELREQYRALDQQCLELAKQLRSNQDGKPQGRQSLAELVDRAFRARQDLQRAEVAESARRLQKIQQTIESREGLKSRIVERRVDELLNPNVDWSKQESEGSTTKLATERKNETEQDRDSMRGENLPGSNSASPDKLREQLALSANSPVNTSDLLRSSPSQIRDLLIENASRMKQRRDEAVSKLIQIPLLGDDENAERMRHVLNENLKSFEADWKYSKRQFEFAKLQYDEIMRYLETAVVELHNQLVTAEEKYSNLKLLFDSGKAAKFEVMAASVRPQELKMELQRVQSLLKLYHAAGNSPELDELYQPTSKLALTFGTTKLGSPKWVAGNGDLSTRSNSGFWVEINLTGKDDTAQVQLSKIPGHDSAQLMLKMAVPNSQSKLWTDMNSEWKPVVNVKITEEEIQAALAGNSVRRSYFLKSDGSMTEIDTDSEAAKTEKDPLVATIELAVP